MHVLSLDLGTKKTGVALGNTEADTIVALTTLSHESREELLDLLRPLIAKHDIHHLVIGLPFLPDGSEGSQALLTKDVAAFLSDSLSLPLTFIDERFTSSPRPHCGDNDAMAACTILEIAFPKLKECI